MKNISLFIVFEGLDGSGKDTVLDRFFPQFYNISPVCISKYQEVLRTREPTCHSKFGKKIISCLEDNTLVDYSAKDVTKWYVADRIQHSKSISKVRSSGGVVLCSRYDLSTYAYQMVMGIDFDFAYDLHRYNKPNGVLIPDLTIYFKLDPVVAFKRVLSRSKNIEAFEREVFLSKVHKQYDKTIKLLKQRDNRNIIVIDASKSKEEVFQASLKAVSNFISKYQKING